MFAYVEPSTYSPILIGEDEELEGTETDGLSATGDIVTLIDEVSLTNVAPELFSFAIAETDKEIFPLSSFGALR